MNSLEEYQNGLLWQMQEDGVLVIGVTQEALDQAGAVQALDLSDLGDEFAEGDWIGEIRGKNSLVEIVAPYPIRITERNRELLKQPSLIEDDPTGDAWILRAERLDG